MSELTAARWTIRDLAATALPDLPVYATPPTAPTAPCVNISARGGEQITARMWEQVYRVTIVAPGGDNEAATRSIEDSIWALALALSQTLAAAFSWEPVSQTTMAGQPCLVSYADVTVSITDAGGTIAPPTYGPPINGYEQDGTGYVDGATHSVGNTFAVSEGIITGLRFYRDAREPAGARAMQLYTDTGTLLATSAMSDDAATNGWVDLALAEPVTVGPGQVVMSAIDRPLGLPYASGTATHTPHIVYQAGWLAELGTFPGGGTSDVNTYATDIILRVKE